RPVGLQRARLANRFIRGTLCADLIAPTGSRTVEGVGIGEIGRRNQRSFDFEAPRTNQTPRSVKDCPKDYPFDPRRRARRVLGVSCPSPSSAMSPWRIAFPATRALHSAERGPVER